MYKANEYRATLVLAAGIAGTALLSGCAARQPVYETSRPDHHWDDREDAAYHRYVADQHLEYRDYKTLSADDQRRYWEWRDHHPG